LCRIWNANAELSKAPNQLGEPDAWEQFVVGFEPGQAQKHKRKKTDKENGLASYLADLCRMAPALA
jgi:hypothetical protein